MNKLSVLCQVFYPDKTSTSQLLHGLFLHLQTVGWEIEIICGFPTTYEKTSSPRREIVDKIRIRRCGFALPLKRAFVFRFLTYISYTVSALWAVWNTPKDRILLGISNPPFTLHILALVSWATQRRFFFYVHDLHPEGLVAINRLSEDNLLTKIWYWLNKKSYHRAEKVFVLGRDMMKSLSKNYRLNADRVCYVPHWSPSTCPPTSIVRPREGIGTKKSRDRFIVQYAGNMGIWHDINTLVEAANLLRDNTDIQFHFIGNGLRRDEAHARAQHYGLDNVSWQPFVPIDQLANTLSTCDVSLVSLRSELAGIAVPCKLYGILAAGKPVIAQVPRESEIALTVEEQSCGIVVSPNDPGALSEAILHFFTNPLELRECGVNALNSYNQFYRVQLAAQKLIDSFGST